MVKWLEVECCDALTGEDKRDPAWLNMTIPPGSWRMPCRRFETGEKLRQLDTQGHDVEWNRRGGQDYFEPDGMGLIRCTRCEGRWPWPMATFVHACGRRQNAQRCPGNPGQCQHHYARQVLA